MYLGKKSPTSHTLPTLPPTITLVLAAFFHMCARFPPPKQVTLSPVSRFLSSFIPTIPFPPSVGHALNEIVMLRSHLSLLSYLPFLAPAPKSAPLPPFPPSPPPSDGRVLNEKGHEIGFLNEEGNVALYEQVGRGAHPTVAGLRWVGGLGWCKRVHRLTGLRRG